MSRRKSRSQVKDGADAAKPVPITEAGVPQEGTSPERADGPARDVAGPGPDLRMPSFTPGIAYFILNQSDRGLQAEDRLRWWLAIKSGPELLLQGSGLEDWVRAARMPEETLKVLAGGLIIRYVGRSSEALRLMRADLEDFSTLVCLCPPGVEALRWEDPCLGAYQKVGRDLARVEDAVRRAEATLDGLGYRWNTQESRIETASGGRPRQLLSELVRGAVIHELASANTPSLRSKIAGILAPFFDHRHLKTLKGSPLYNAVDNALASS